MFARRAAGLELALAVTALAIVPLAFGFCGVLFEHKENQLHAFHGHIFGHVLLILSTDSWKGWSGHCGLHLQRKGSDQSGVATHHKRCLLPSHLRRLLVHYADALFCRALC